LRQVKTEEKSNEITAIPELLHLLDLSGCIVTIDAMGCQKKIAKQIVGVGADDVLALKRNQERMYRHVGAFFEWAEKKDFEGVTLATCDTLDTGHGRSERRRYVVSPDVAWLPKYRAWAGLRTIGMVESARTEHGKTSIERRFFLSSLALDVEQFARAVRGHWQIENGLHWVLDIAFGDDDSRVRVGHAAENLELLRHLPLSLLKQERSEKRGIKGKRLSAGWNETYLVKVLFG
jgi:predicted transposase YbfD/YdcC